MVNELGVRAEARVREEFRSVVAIRLAYRASQHVPRVQRQHGRRRRYPMLPRHGRQTSRAGRPHPGTLITLHCFYWRAKIRRKVLAKFTNFRPKKHYKTGNSHFCQLFPHVSYFPIFCNSKGVNSLMKFDHRLCLGVFITPFGAEIQCQPP